ncbi:MAG: alpha-2-macroglobulin [Planctomycetota bacterium]
MAHGSEWIDTAFGLIDGLNSNWQYRFDRVEWQKEHWRENPEEITLPHDEWQRRKGLEEDRRRWARTLELYEEILAVGAGTEVRTRVLFERGMRRLLAMGRNPAWNSFTAPAPRRLIEELFSRGEPPAESKELAKWLEAIDESLADWRRLAKEFPHHSRADDATFLIAHATERFLGELPAAIERYQDLLDTYPESQWVGNARSRIEEIKKEEIVFEGRSPFPAGRAPQIPLRARNVGELLCRLYPVDSLLDLVEGQRHLRSKAFAVPDTAPHTSWRLATGCGDDHKARVVELLLPQERAGSYLLRISGEKSDVETLIVISDISLVLEAGETEAIAWVTNADDGNPREGATVLYRIDLRRRYKGTTEWRSFTHREVTGADGIARWSYPEGFRPGHTGPWRFDALTAAAELGAHAAPTTHFRVRRDHLRTPRWVYYLETDRPAYRPAQTVHYKISFRYWDGEAYRDAEEGVPFEIEFRDPRNEPILKRSARTAADGAVAGSIELPREATLGMAQLQVLHEGSTVRSRNWQRNAFRVEEYRLPEFEVIVSTPDEPVLVGDPLTVKVEGKYLSGEPVRRGKVRIRVTRRPFLFRYAPTRRYPWFYSSRNEHGYWGEEEVVSAGGELDPDGIAEFPIPTLEFGDERDSTYQVSAWVTDSAQREETATKGLPVTHTDLFAHLYARLRLHSPGEEVTIDVRTLEADGDGIAASGEIEVARRRDREEERDGEIVVITEWEPMETTPFDTRAEATPFRWVADEEGELRFAFRARDRRGNLVEASTTVWVVGPRFTGRDYRIQNVEIVSAAEEYALGDRARFAILSPFADASFLVVRSGGGRILDAREVRARGQVAQVEYPVAVAETPNFFVTAWLIHERQLFRAQRRLLVPPEHVYLTATLEASAEEVLPGDDLTLRLKVRDREGKPVAGSFSLTLFDRAVLSIQPEIAVSPLEHFHAHTWSFQLRGGHSSAWSSARNHRWNAGMGPRHHRVRALPDLLQRSWRFDYDYLGKWYQQQAGELLELGGEPMYFGLEAGAPRDSSGRPSRARGRAAGVAGEILLDESEADFEEDSRRGALSPASSLGMAKKSKRAFGGGKGAGQGGGDSAPLRVRSNFSATAIWKARFETGAEGLASVTVPMPDSLTSWKGIARGITSDGRAMEARVEVRTRKQIRARLAAPRFFRELDEVVISVIATNAFTEAVDARVTVSAPAQILTLMSPAPENPLSGLVIQGDRAFLTIAARLPAEGEWKLDIPLEVTGTGDAEITVAVETPRESDGLRRIIPALPYGLDRFIGGAGMAPDLDGISSSDWRFQVPEKSDQESRELVIDLTPSPAIALIESLPYLVLYPYGCVEQTLNRFLPAAVVAETLKKTGVDLAEILPERPAQIPAGFWGHLKERPLELFRPGDLERLLKSGAARLKKQQNPDGSWGWWSGAPGDPYITALVIDGLATAIDAGVPLDRGPLERGAQWLRNHLLGRDLAGETKIYERPDHEGLAFIGRALFHAARLGAISGEGARDALEELAGLLYRFREGLGAQGKALLALGIHDLGIPGDERPAVLLRNLEDLQVRKPRWGTTHFGKRFAYLWWYESGVESTAHALRAFLAIAPGDSRIPEMVRWLLENREGSHYDSTRSTAVVALALSEYLKESGELNPDLHARVFLDGEAIGELSIRREDVFARRHRIRVGAEVLEAGEHVLQVQRSGRGNLYWNAGFTFYSQEDPIPASGNRMAITRRYFKLQDRRETRTVRDIVDGRAVDRDLTSWTRMRLPLVEGAILEPGDRIEVELEVESANRFRYLVFEDRKPAGLEAVAVRSGYVGGVFSYRELRDDRVVHFSSRLPEGTHRTSYELRAERPGRFHALPTTGYAMYLPHVRANSASDRITVAVDGKE